MLSLLKQINECRDLSNFNSRGLETEQKTESESKNEGKAAGRREKRDQDTHTHTHTHASTHASTRTHGAFLLPFLPPPRPSPVKLVHTIVPGRTLQLASPPGYSITWRLRRSLAENGQPPLPAGSPSLTSQGGGWLQVPAPGLGPICSAREGAWVLAPGCIGA